MANILSCFVEFGAIPSIASTRLRLPFIKCGNDIATGMSEIINTLKSVLSVLPIRIRKAVAYSLRILGTR